jgi:hypothetical protein
VPLGSAGAAIARARATLRVSEPFATRPSKSRTAYEIGKLPSSVGVPNSDPPEVSCIPAGARPDVTVKAIGARPPVTGRA